MEYALRLENLVKEFDGKKAVDKFSLNLKKGEILGLLGPNGAGKTTTIRMIMNIMVPDSGKVHIFGKPFSEKTKDILGYLPEERGLYRKLSIIETLDFFGKLKGMSKNLIASRGMELLNKFDLFGHKDKKIEELSKGMAQKLQFITTILHKPDLLILDEPFSGLDPVNIELVKDIILEKKKEGVTIIFSTHLMDYAEKIVDSVIMINKGKKVLEGELDEVRAKFGNKVLHINYSGNSEFVAKLDNVIQVRDYGNEMEVELSDMRYKDIVLRQLIDKLSINSLSITEPSLNSIFISKVKSKGTQNSEQEVMK
jgi:ABC-2 type transport system ATP-binding protein